MSAQIDSPGAVGDITYDALQQSEQQSQAELDSAIDGTMDCFYGGGDPYTAVQDSAVGDLFDPYADVIYDATEQAQESSSDASDEAQNQSTTSDASPPSSSQGQAADSQTDDSDDETAEASAFSQNISGLATALAGQFGLPTTTDADSPAGTTGNGLVDDAPDGTVSDLSQVHGIGAIGALFLTPTHDECERLSNTGMEIIRLEERIAAQLLNDSKAKAHGRVPRIIEMARQLLTQLERNLNKAQKFYDEIP